MHNASLGLKLFFRLSNKYLVMGAQQKKRKVSKVFCNISIADAATEKKTEKRWFLEKVLAVGWSTLAQVMTVYVEHNA